MSDQVLKIRDLKVDFDTPDGTVQAVRGVDLDLESKETVAIVGESGSGKSQVVLATMGLLASNGRAAGKVDFKGQELLSLRPRALNRIRGKRITMIFQEPMTSLDPLYRVGRQISEPLVVHGGLSRRQARPRVLELLNLVGIPRADERIDAYPHELSGGQRQRVMIAMALANEPEILIADEPTTALDVTVQAQILELMADLQRRFDMGIVFITHDLNIVRRIAERVYVMHRGKVVETGKTDEIFRAPKRDYTRMLIEAEPAGRKMTVPQSAPVLLEGRNITVRFDLGGGWFGKERRELIAVDDIDIVIKRGQTLGVVGESGSGKSTLGRALLRLIHSQGAITFDGETISGHDRRTMRPMRRRLQVVFQDPYGSLSPRLTVGQIIGEGLKVHQPNLTSRERQHRVREALEAVQLEPAMARRFPHEFSGGQRQRIAIARALILRPDFMLLDEPTSALDRSVQKQVVDLLRDLQKEFGLTYLFISHDLAVVRAMADTVLVMKNGVIVEQGPTDAIFDHPQTAYTQELMAAAFEHHPDKLERQPAPAA